MAIWGNSKVSGQNDRGKVNRSRPTHYDISMSSHYDHGLYTYRYTTVNIILYLDRERWIQCFIANNANVKCAGPNESQVAFTCVLSFKQLFV